VGEDHLGTVFGFTYFFKAIFTCTFLKNIKKYKDGYGIGKEGNKLIVYLLL
jgi:hypothetical protein